ncbi:MAG: polymer-forming cytoskeletal protein [Alphaproteobacteria bacterium]
MFRSSRRGSNVMAPAPAVPRRAASLIDGDLVVEGDIQGASVLVVHGTVLGAVHADQLVVGRTGRIEGPVGARAVRIDGVVTGDVLGETVYVGASARIVGNVTHSSISIEPGAEIDGRRPWRPAGHVATG